MNSLVNLPVIMVTARNQSADVVEALEFGANDYVTKPLDLRVTLARIRTQLSLRRAAEQVGRLETRLAQRNRELESAAAERAAAERRGRDDLDEAARLQRALLPPDGFAVPGYRFAWALRPAAALAGGLLGVLPLGERRLGLYAVDVAGHGVAAAFRAAAAARLLERAAAAVPGDATPARVAAEFSRQLDRSPLTDQPVCLAFGILDRPAGEFRSVAAGFPPPLHLPAGGEPVPLTGAGPPIVRPRDESAEAAVSLRPGDRLYLCSDGVTAALNPVGEHFGDRRLREALCQRRAGPLGEAVAAVVAAVEGWTGPAGPSEELTLLALEVAGPGSPGGGQP
jgi:sigma-B regulation protein RsbU (phosphoserine phosphatase)